MGPPIFVFCLAVVAGTGTVPGTGTYILYSRWVKFENVNDISTTLDGILNGRSGHLLKKRFLQKPRFSIPNTQYGSCRNV